MVNVHWPVALKVNVQPVQNAYLSLAALAIVLVQKDIDPEKMDRVMVFFFFFFNISLR